MAAFRITSLQQRLALFLLLPVALLLFAMGMTSFLYSRNSILSQWREATILKLRRGGHEVDMRLNEPAAYIRMVHGVADRPGARALQTAIIQEIGKLEGVADVRIQWEATDADDVPAKPKARGRMGRRMNRMFDDRITTITPPEINPSLKMETVSLISYLKDASGETIGELTVVMRFDYLVNAATESGWWRRYRAYLVDPSGTVLTSSAPGSPHHLGESGNALETATLEAMKSASFGTVFGDGHPPEEVSGFYRLETAPWFLVIVAPGREVLAPLLQFRFYYVLFGCGFILVVLVLMRVVTGQTCAAIRKVSHAARRITEGRYDIELPVKTHDEVGELVESFNTMTVQLEERSRLKHSLNLAMEVQQNLLPRKPPATERLDIAGRSDYCDETGGDYYDFMAFGNGITAVAVGDVAGHGIPSALLMTTARALLRSRMASSHDLPEVMGHINRLLCDDTGDSGNFMTLLLIRIDENNRRLEWVPAGHDAALLYDPDTDAVTELPGRGLALGIEKSHVYESRSLHPWPDGMILFMGTDGLWEARNPAGNAFGKGRLREILRRHAAAPAAEIRDAIFKAVARFRGDARQMDDATAVVVKAVNQDGRDV